MPEYPGQIISKLPNVGTSIFAVMSKLAAENNAINLSQGFPDYQISERLISRVNYYMKKGFNQYAPMPGVPQLRRAIAAKVQQSYQVMYNPETEITITAGATQALYSVITAFVKEGDEVIIFEPAYDSYAPAVRLQGGLVKYVRLASPGFGIQWDDVTKLVSNRTRMIIINSPHNPSGSLMKHDDMKQLELLTKNRDIIVLSDEVYEHLVFDGNRHFSACLFPGLASRSLIVGSFGKTFHATGWKTGYVLAPENLTVEFRKIHQFNVFAANTPIQHALADMLKDEQSTADLPAFFQAKRDLFTSLISKSRLKPLRCEGTYFQLLDYSTVSDLPEKDFATWLVREHKLAVIPLSAFYHDQLNQKLVRVCFAKTEETLTKAAEILCRI
jgi:methionine aminotransferase